jgi:hypothetical protein
LSLNESPQNFLSPNHRFVEFPSLWRKVHILAVLVLAIPWAHGPGAGQDFSGLRKNKFLLFCRSYSSPPPSKMPQ